MSPLRLLSAVLAASSALVAAQSYELPPVVDCGSVSQHNDIWARYPMNATGVLNGTLALLPLPLSLVRSIIPAKYEILESAYRDVIPDLPEGYYPALLQVMHDHDIRYGQMKMNDFQRASIEFPFIDFFGDGSTSFRWNTAMFMSGTNEMGLGAIAKYGIKAFPTSFSPSCNAYNQPSKGVYAFGGSATNTSSQCEPGKPCIDTLFTTKGASLDRYLMSFFANATNQPTFGNGETCNNQIRIFSSESAEWRPVPVTGKVYTAGGLGVGKDHDGYEVDMADVHGAVAATRFIENNYIPCEQYRGFGEHSVRELLKWTPPTASPSADLSANATNAAAKHSPLPPTLAAPNQAIYHEASPARKPLKCAL